MLRLSRFAAPTVNRLVSRSIAPAASRFYSISIPESSPVRKYGSGDIKLRFSKDHEWLALHEDNTAFVGISEYAADSLGDLVYVELPEVGTTVEAGDSIGAVESVKSASDIYSPVEGEIVEVNEQLNSTPGVINKDPMGEGWFVRIQLANPNEIDSLLDDTAYEEFLAENSD
ncbi:hypothetical protein CANCADRAFT_111448 [Tortispora caseinolytica NRRL Y-17796]|uniref:Glycine cleavage system H protein n=1 Tax=Tortispora caseinolytica NRRL Y-17796 TaxID=767744 RepID=A0A1E4TGC8_9ASCO|nr:hypothetical protein CANCADRAFT_111448 [Tortispora caseinolytica NRRL Y-17796]